MKPEDIERLEQAVMSLVVQAMRDYWTDAVTISSRRKRISRKTLPKTLPGRRLPQWEYPARKIGCMARWT